MLVFVGVLAVWEAWAQAADEYSVPTVGEVAKTAWRDWPTSEFMSDVGMSLKRLAAGYAIAAVVSIALGLAMGSSRGLRRTLDPFFELLRAVPAISIVPVAILVFGLGDTERIAVIAWGVSFPILVNTIEGVRNVPPEVRDTASMLHLGRVERALRVYLPSALPSIFTGLRISLSLALVMVVISEFVGEGNGLGHAILVHQSLFSVPEMYAGVLFLGLLGYLLNTVFLAVERRVLAWHYGAAGE